MKKRETDTYPNSRNKRGFYYHLLGVLGLLFAAAFFLLFAYTSYEKKSELKAWKAVDAIVVSSSVRYYPGGRKATHCPEVQVQYLFRERQYTSKLDIKDGPCNLIQKIVVSTINDYPEGKLVKAMVNPKAPMEIRDADFSLGIPFYSSILGAVVCLIGTIFGFRASKVPLAIGLLTVYGAGFGLFLFVMGAGIVALNWSKASSGVSGAIMVLLGVLCQAVMYGMLNLKIWGYRLAQIVWLSLLGLGIALLCLRPVTGWIFWVVSFNNVAAILILIYLMRSQVKVLVNEKINRV